VSAALAFALGALSAVGVGLGVAVVLAIRFAQAIDGNIAWYDEEGYS
jgi:uncharacterized protein (DUF2062 family)